MKLYAGATTLDDLRLCIDLGATAIITNPEGMCRFSANGETLVQITKTLCRVADVPVWIQVHGPNAEAIAAKALTVAAVSPQVGVKIVSSREGLRAIRHLRRQGVRALATAVFSVGQAIAAAAAGAAGVCPFITRGLQGGQDAFQVLSDILRAFEAGDLSAEVVAASISEPWQVERAAICGAHAVALRLPVLLGLMDHRLTVEAEAMFGSYWARIPGEDVSYLHHGMTTADPSLERTRASE